MDGILHCGDEYYVKLNNVEDWLNAVNSIRVSLPVSFATEVDALVTSRNLQVLINQAVIFAFKPIEGDTSIARTSWASYFEEDLSESLTIELEEYYAIDEAIAHLREDYEDALMGSVELWRPTMAETVFKLMAIAQERIESAEPTTEKLKLILSGFCEMLEGLAIQEGARLMNEIVPPQNN